MTPENAVILLVEDGEDDIVLVGRAFAKAKIPIHSKGKQSLMVSRS
jgi:hypothetical protein